jgi:hypothetical protein
MPSHRLILDFVLMGNAQADKCQTRLAELAPTIDELPARSRSDS